MDYRFRWVRDRLCKTLGVYEPRYIETVLAEFYEELVAFFDDEISDHREDHKKIFFAYRTFYDKLVEEEVKALEPGERFFFWKNLRKKSINIFFPFPT